MYIRLEYPPTTSTNISHFPYIFYRVPVPVDKVIFLTSRIDKKLTESATLISSQAGQVKLWSVFGTKNFLGM